jgi:hypothetical protein
MTVKQVAIRIGSEGKADFKRDMGEIGQSSQDAGDKTVKAFDAAGDAADRAAQRYQRMAQAAKQAAATDRSQSNLAYALGANQSGASAKDSAAVFKAAADQADNLASRTAALRAQINPLGAAQDLMNKAIADSSGLLAAGAISEAEHTAAVTLARKAYADAEAGLKALIGGMNTGQTMAFTAAIRHMIDATIAGRPPLQALGMEVGNLSYALGGGGGGIMGAAKAAAAGLLSMIGVTGAVAIGIGAIVAVAGAAYYSYISQQAELEGSLRGIGKASGATLDQMNAIAEGSAAASGISVSSARSIEEAFAQSGKIGVDSFSDLTGIVVRFAAQTGESMDESKAAITAGFADPAKGVDTLGAKIGALDDKTRQYILTLMSQNNLAGAQKALYVALNNNLDDAATHATALGRAWNFIANAASDAWSAMGRGINQAFAGAPLAKQLQDLQAERAAAAQGVGQTVDTNAGAVQLAPRPLKDIDADISAVQSKITDLTNKAKQAASDAAANTASVAVGNIARAADAGYDSYQSLIANQKQLNAALADPAVAKRLANLQQVQAAQDAYNRAVETYLTPAQKAAALDDLDIKALAAKTPAQKAAIASERERIELAGKVITTAEANADVTRAGAKATAEAQAAVDKHAKSVVTETAVLDANARSALNSANAYLQGASAGMIADAQAKALTDSIKKGSDEQLRARQMLQDAIADQARDGARQVVQLDAQADAQKTANDAVVSGSMTAAQAREQMQTELALRPLLIAQALAEGDAKTALTAIINRLRQAYANDNSEANRSRALDEIDSQNQSIDLLRAQIALQTTGDSARDVELAQLQAKQSLLKMGVDAESAEGRQIIENAGNIEVMRQQLELAAQSRSELESLFDSIGSKFSDFITQGKFDWKDFASAALSALQDIESEFIKLAVLNPLKNALFGTNLPGLDSVGGILGSILGNGSSTPVTGGNDAGNVFGGGVGSVIASIAHTGSMAGMGSATRELPSNVLRFAPRFHGGGFLGPDEVPAILQTGERVLNRRETKRYNANDGGVIYAPVTIQTPNPGAFQASKGQIAASLARAVQAGSRRF